MPRRLLQENSPANDSYSSLNYPHNRKNKIVLHFYAMVLADQSFLHEGYVVSLWGDMGLMRSAACVKPGSIF